MTLPASGQKWLDTLETMRAAIAELAAERDRYRDALVARHGGEPLALLSELDAARAERDAVRQELNELDIYLRCRGAQGEGSTKAFDGRNLVVHAQDSAEVAMVLRTERDEARRERDTALANTSLPGYVRLVEERDAAVAKCAELERERAYYKLVSEGWSDAEARGEVWPAAAEQGGA